MPAIDQLISQSIGSPFGPPNVMGTSQHSALDQILSARGGPSKSRNLAPAAPQIALTALPSIADKFRPLNELAAQESSNVTFFAEQQRQAKLIADQANAASASMQLFGSASPEASPFASPSAKDQSRRQKIVAAAMAQIGVPYSWGGGNAKGPTKGIREGAKYPDQAVKTVGFDCSGLVLYAYAQAGLKAPRVSYGQLKMGSRAALKDLKPGDLVGFGNGHHIGIYIGNGKYIHAPYTGAKVQVSSLKGRKDAWGVHIVM